MSTDLLQKPQLIRNFPFINDLATLQAIDCNLPKREEDTAQTENLGLEASRSKPKSLANAQTVSPLCHAFAEPLGRRRCGVRKVHDVFAGSGLSER